MDEQVTFLTEKQQKSVLKIFFKNPRLKDEIELFNIRTHSKNGDGKLGIGPVGVVLVRYHDKDRPAIGALTHRDFVSDVMHELYGRQITYGMGNYAMRNWSFSQSREDLNELLASIQEYLHASNKNRVDYHFRGKFINTAKNILAVVESLNIDDPVWKNYEFYNQLGLRR